MGNRERVLWLVIVVVFSAAIGVMAWQNYVQWQWLYKHQTQIDNNWKFIEDQSGTIGELQVRLDDFEQEGHETGEYVFHWMKAASDWMRAATDKINEFQKKFEQEDGWWKEERANERSVF